MSMVGKKEPGRRLGRAALFAATVMILQRTVTTLTSDIAYTAERARQRSPAGDGHRLPRGSRAFDIGKLWAILRQAPSRTGRRGPGVPFGMPPGIGYPRPQREPLPRYVDRFPTGS
jgi:hypothetical protein